MTEFKWMQDHCIVRPLSEKDVKCFCELYEEPLSREKALWMIRYLNHKENIDIFCICDETNQAAGLIELYHPEKNGAREIGYRMMAERQKEGLCKKGVSILVSHMKDMGIPYLDARADLNNPASCHILETSGFRKLMEVSGTNYYKKVSI